MFSHSFRICFVYFNKHALFSSHVPCAFLQKRIRRYFVVSDLVITGPLWESRKCIGFLLIYLD